MGFEDRLRDITYKQLKTSLLIGSVLFLFFVSIIFYEVISDEGNWLTKDMEVDLKVEKVKTVKGMLVLEDSLSIPGGTPLISPIKKMKAFANYENNVPKRYTLSQVVPKFRFTKKAHSDTITVYHYGDTLLFKLLSD